MEARTPRTNDRGVGEDGNRSSFKSVTLPHYMCRFAKLTEVLPPLYLHGLSSGNFVLGLGQSFGNAAGLSAATITRLTEWCFPQAEFPRAGDAVANRRAAADLDVPPSRTALAILTRKSSEYGFMGRMIAPAGRLGRR